MNNICLENQNRKFFNFWSRYYDKGFFSKILLNIIIKTIKSIKIKNNSRVLDVGCGTGSLLYLLENRNLGLELYGMDISEKMLKIAEKKLNKTKLIIASAFDINKKFKENFFDYIFVVDAFHHIPEKEKIMKKFYKILKKNGKLIITDFDFGPLFNFIFYLIEPGNSGVPTKKQILELFRESNFFVEKQKKLNVFSLMTAGIKNGK